LITEWLQPSDIGAFPLIFLDSFSAEPLDAFSSSTLEFSSQKNAD
jgi:hypothetical protein